MCDGGGQGCTFLSKDLGWVPYDAKNSHLDAPKPVGESWKDPKTTLLISIASFRDALCPKTLFNLFTKAQYPGRITVSVIQQNVHGEDVDCLDTYCELMEEDWKALGNGKGGEQFVCPYKEQVLIKRVNAKDARGPQWARAQASKVILDRPLGKDEFCLQMDSHMDFVHNFDSHMMEMWAQTDNEYGILSTYVTASENLHLFEGENAKGVNGVHEVPHLCMITLQGQHSMPRNWGTKCARALPHPKLTNSIWGAGLSFSKCHAERKVPYDPHLPYIFDGEEFSRSVRFFTWGYDVYTPHRVYVVHDYTNSQKDPLHFAWTRNRGGSGGGAGSGTGSGAVHHPYDEVDNDDKLQASDSVKRIFRLLGRSTYSEAEREEEEEAMRLVQRSRYGLGDRRTLDQAAAFTGVDLKRWRVDNKANNRCGNLEYVPFKEHPRGAAYEPKYDPATEAFADERDAGSVYLTVGGKSKGQGQTPVKAPTEALTASEKTATEANKLPSTLASPGQHQPLYKLPGRMPALPFLSSFQAGEGSRLDFSSHPHSTTFRLAQGVCVLVILFVVAAGGYSLLKRGSKRAKSAIHKRLAKDQ